ncbi:hypothetical protein COV05_00995 [Candidatus Uhrbacteria bacterium CG10_big_fil_rev_8_21_14_0_10_48_16]|uniref:DUF3179 domain-containing protein n=1 Tax=Candidatus Uhrbacteria bacterium CG10_big_fil_rev_8_21_14_0_10_48_16 TaxID=1975038 RepID=A0A2M8LIB1_9BACT|nr:MAG: hypothetical protein COV05_00995 [Candidatus Uhrbacteria bacterium CG10_big_fil_rev_8_21_14_0_10_48_16]
MSRYTLLLFISFLLVGVGILFYQYRSFRSPLLFLSQEDPIVEIVVANPQLNAIPSIDQPAYESMASADVYLNDAGFGLAVEAGNQVRFYPYQILVWHGVVNDELNGEPLLVTYDPLCNSGLVYRREIHGEEETFGVSGKLWNNNTLLFDTSTESLWSQLTSEAIQGEFTDTRLDRYPSQVMTWTQFKTQYSGEQVLSRETGHVRDYTQNPYEQAEYETSSAIWFPLSEEDTRLNPKSLVFGLEREGIVSAFPVDSWSEFDTIMEQMEDGDILQPSFWFCWASLHPGTEIYSLND